MDLHSVRGLSHRPASCEGLKSQDARSSARNLTDASSSLYSSASTESMEALGAAASVAGLISLAVEIPKLIDTAISIWSAPEEAKQLSKTTDALIMTLWNLERFLKTDDAQAMNMAGDSALTVSISACQSRVLDLSKKLRSQTSTTSAAPAQAAGSRIKTAISRFRWPFEKKECLAIISELHAMQSTFEFCLVMRNWSVSIPAWQTRRHVLIFLLHTQSTNVQITQGGHG